MGHEVSIRRVRLTKSRWAAAAILVLVVALLGFVPPVNAHNDHVRTNISGNATPAGPTDCPARGAGAIVLTGDLAGCLIFFPRGAKCEELDGFVRYREWGREVFIGTYDGERGRFRTRYNIDATYSQNACADVEKEDFDTFFGKQLTGGCEHRIKAGTGQGVFEGVGGVINFFDVIPTAPGYASNFYYAGVLRKHGA